MRLCASWPVGRVASNEDDASGMIHFAFVKPEKTSDCRRVQNDREQSGKGDKIIE
jgi:hypothetical protein